MCVVLCSKGYPETYDKNVRINGFKNVKIDNKKDYLFHAGTSEINKKIYATGGRVLNFVSVSKNFSTARNKIHKNLNKLNWEGGFYRKDIGFKVIN